MQRGQELRGRDDLDALIFPKGQQVTAVAGDEEVRLGGRHAVKDAVVGVAAGDGDSLRYGVNDGGDAAQICDVIRYAVLIPVKFAR